ncbi:MAG: thiamine diphosphokinase [Bacillaceae bacterium]
MIINIIAGGPITKIPPLSQYEGENVKWVGVDRGVYYLLQQGIIPDQTFGDFDSVNEEELTYIQKQVPVSILPAEKDESDLELALNWAFKQNPSFIQLFGATGGRLDHELSNIQLLIKGLRVGVDIHIIDKQNKMQLLKQGTYELNSDDTYKYLSLLPFTEKVIGMTLDGWKYNLINTDLEWGTTLCISNEFVGKKGTISFQTGIVIVIRSIDEKRGI